MVGGFFYDYARLANSPTVIYEINGDNFAADSRVEVEEPVVVSLFEHNATSQLFSSSFLHILDLM
jgi:hypothetical protein